MAKVVREAVGWRRRGIAFLAGALSVLAMAPFFLWPVLFFTLPVLIWLIDGTSDQALAHAEADKATHTRAWRTSLKRAAFDGWWFGFGYFFFGLFWIGEAFLVEAHIFGWLLPVAVTLMPAGLALFTAVTAAAARSFWVPGLSRVAVLAVAFGVGEWLRGHIFTGFPWNVLGYALTQPLYLMQSTAVFGIYGLTLLTVLIAATPVIVLADPRTPRPGAKIVALTVAPLAALFIYGALVLAPGPNSFVDGVKLRIVQPSIPQHEKWLASEQPRIFAEHLRLSRISESGKQDDLEGVTHVFWPEAAMPFLPLSTPDALSAIGTLLPANTFLVAGALRLEKASVGDELRPSTLPKRQVYNSIIAFGPEGETRAIYDKIHLVPFGEYLPAQEFLEAIGLESLTRIRGGFSIGSTPRPLVSVPGLPPFSPLICYEAIFPAAVVQGENRPALLVNATNDGWFGNTTGPHQHLHQARLRAVEEGVALLRVANNGISAVIDPFGRIIGKLDLNEVGTLDTQLPQPRPATIYAQYGDGLFLLCVLALSLTTWIIVQYNRYAAR
ncbi:Apolipoprotein N-acyltransferase [Candidatus Filomicrobium marinum]|uniref:Apolipoprotein N-acyltransferase n=1 Tax=Candidatus Filomicrobium marinum TaxID=1608628 RepID=A0A0D6JFU5_9HYPH|nr:apolipoprotein N-acyltransferase [Candidatus Filomicrobium marinum]CPR19566.1 Apolipoprotein N-acyltransferase [Candidatus Filomicrobium marinum]